MALRFDSLKTTSNLNGITAGSTVGMATVDVGDGARQKIRSLAANVTVTAATSTLTVTLKWQVSNDKSTWTDVVNGPQNAAGVVFTTGTAAAKSAVVEAPATVYGFRYCRLSLVTGAATGGASDTYAVGYSFRSPA